MCCYVSKKNGCFLKYSVGFSSSSGIPLEPVPKPDFKDEVRHSNLTGDLWDPKKTYQGFLDVTHEKREQTEGAGIGTCQLGPKAGQ